MSTDSDGMEFMMHVVSEMRKIGIQITPYWTKEEQYNIGESHEGFEVKLDKRCFETGHLHIEIAESRIPGNPLVKSGIFRFDNTKFYIQGNYEGFYLFDVEKLRQLCEVFKFSVWQPVQTVKVFQLPLQIANRNCILKIPI